MGDTTANSSIFASEAIGILASERALWFYSWIGLAILMVLLALSVVRMIRVTRDLRPADFLERPGGAAPRKRSTIRKRIVRLRNFQRRTAIYVVGLVMGIIFVGAVIPGGILALIAVWQDWFLPGPSALLIDGAPFSMADTTQSELGLFILDQALRGGLADTMEVYRLTLTRIESNPENFVYSGLVLLYRLVSGAAMLAILYALVRIVFGLHYANEAIAELEKQIAAH